MPARRKNTGCDCCLLRRIWAVQLIVVAVDAQQPERRNAVRAEKAKKHPGENEKFWILVEEYVDRFKPQ
jgi:hypothetical protein